MSHKLKICMVGATGVGKSSLVDRFVSSIFSERYQTTIGVRIQSRRMEHHGAEVELVLWDLSGEDEFQNVQPAYLRGATGYLVVADGTRRGTVQTALILQARVQDVIGNEPFVFVLNKADLVAAWEVTDGDVRTLQNKGPLLTTSAKTGAGVEAAFRRLIQGILEGEARPWT